MHKAYLIVLLSLGAIFPFYAQYSFSKNEIIGKQVPLGGNSNPYKLRSEVYEAFTRMQKAAQKEGVKIAIISGYRSYDRQLYIWNRKFNRYKKQGLSDSKSAKKIIEYSTCPGTSRHHWGTDMDIVQQVEKMPKQLLVAKNFNNKGAFCELHQWMQRHAADYGFYLVYTNDKNRTGFSYEPWHYSYRPTSIKILKKALELRVYERLLEKQETVLNFSYFKTHILGVDSVLRP